MVELHEHTKERKTQPITDLGRYMLDKYGPLISQHDLAELLNKSYISLHSFLQRSNSDEAQQLRDAKRQVGRRCFFNTLKISAFLEG